MSVYSSSVYMKSILRTAPSNEGWSVMRGFILKLYLSNMSRWAIAWLVNLKPQASMCHEIDGFTPVLSTASDVARSERRLAWQLLLEMLGIDSECSKDPASLHFWSLHCCEPIQCARLASHVLTSLSDVEVPYSLSLDELEFQAPKSAGHGIVVPDFAPITSARNNFCRKTRVFFHRIITL